MKKIISIVIIYVVCSSTSFSANIVDIYGAEKGHAEVILKKYSKEVADIQSEFTQENILSDINGKENTKKMLQIRARKALLIKKIKKDGKFSFVYIHTTSYPGEKNIYTTIEVVENNQPDRLRFVSPEFKQNDYRLSHAQSDLINEMIEYDALVMNLIITNKLNNMENKCPVYHCFVGFGHPELKPYLNRFNVGAIKEKKLIMDTLNHDADPNRRAAAAFLTGHFNDPKDIMSTLLPHVNDKSNSVRNSAMRVIGSTMEKAKMTQIDVMPFLDLLNSPYGTDRNKASIILLNAAEVASSRSLIIRKGKDNLLSMLRLKQLNNHEYAYLILKKISGKTYGEYDIDAWDKWLTTAQNALKKHSV